MTFKTEDGVGPPNDWQIAMAEQPVSGAVIMIDTKGRGIFQIEAGSVEGAYWLACLINEGLGVGDNDDEVAS